MDMDKLKSILHHFQDNAMYCILTFKFKLMEKIQVTSIQNITHTHTFLLLLLMQYC